MMTGSGGVPILMYHSLSRSAAAPFRRFTLDPTLFEEHLSYLTSERYRVLTMSELTDLRQRHEPLPAKTVVLTFDDGFADFHTHALPPLVRYGLTATVYMVSAHVGGTSEWLRPEGESDRRLLSWDQLAEISANGIECAAHTHTHPELDLLNSRQILDELSRSKGSLEERLQVPVRTCAYPYGYHRARVRAMAAAAGYQSACAVADHVSGDGDRFAVPRLTVSADTTVGDLIRLLEAGLPSVGSRRWDRSKQLVWRGVRQHAPSVAPLVARPTGRTPT